MVKIIGAIRKIIEGVDRCNDDNNHDLLRLMLCNITLSRIGVTLICYYELLFELDYFEKNKTLVKSDCEFWFLGLISSPLRSLSPVCSNALLRADSFAFCWIAQLSIDEHRYRGSWLYIWKIRPWIASYGITREALLHDLSTWDVSWLVYQRHRTYDNKKCWFFASGTW